MRKILNVIIMTIGLSTITFANDVSLITEIENIHVDLDTGSELTPNQRADVLRHIENRGRYTGGTKWSTGWGAYMFLKGTRKFIFKTAKLKTSKGKALNEWNWKTRSNQDKMYRWYMNYIKNITRKDITNDSMLTDYITWQSGPAGAKLSIKTIKGEHTMKLSEFAVMRANMSVKDKKKLRRYMMFKLRQYNKLYNLHMSKKYLRNGYASVNDFAYMMRKHGRSHYRKAMRDLSKVFANVWGMHYANKVKHYSKKYIKVKHKVAKTTKAIVKEVLSNNNGYKVIGGIKMPHCDMNIKGSDLCWM